MTRFGATFLTLAMLLLGAPAGADDERAEVPAPCPIHAEKTCRAAAEPETTPDADTTASTGAAGAGETTLDDLPIYVPPSRGTTSMRVGGATRGGERPGTRL